MDTPRTELQSLLLEILSTRCRVDPASVARLNAQDWECLMTMARQHRLLPLLHWRLTREHAGLPVPGTVSEELQGGFKFSAIRALLMQRELLLAHRLLENAGIPHTALKGAYLAFHAYPHPALRPLRDLDILVPKALALTAYQVLLEGGYTRIKEYRGDPKAALETRKHLPPLLSSSGQVAIELHARLTTPRETNEFDFAEEPGYWRRTTKRVVAGATLSYPSPADQLLHLIVHAIYDHQLDNGPLVLSDVAYLLETHPIDWLLFWRLAKQGSRTRGCLLVLKMAEHYFGEQPVTWPKDTGDFESMDTMVTVASLLSLRDYAARSDVTITSEALNHTTVSEKLRFLARRAFPNTKEIATQFPVSEDSPRIYLWYAVKWWRMLTVRLPGLVASAMNCHTPSEARQLAQLHRWLQQ